MILEVPATGERIAATLLEHSGVLCLKVAPSELIAYVLKGVLDAGWRIVDTTAGPARITAQPGTGRPQDIRASRVCFARRRTDRRNE